MGRVPGLSITGFLVLLLVPGTLGQVDVIRTVTGNQVDLVVYGGDQLGVIVTETAPGFLDGSPDRAAGHEISWLFTSRTGVGTRTMSYQATGPVQGMWMSIDKEGIVHQGSVTAAGLIPSPGGGSGGPASSGAPVSRVLIPLVISPSGGPCVEGALQCRVFGIWECQEGAWTLRTVCEGGCLGGYCLESAPAPEPLFQSTGLVASDDFSIWIGVVVVLVVVVWGGRHWLRRRLTLLYNSVKILAFENRD